jgi:hypothetical protein
MDDLLKEAIADAKQVRETALANAKMALEEAFTPRLQSMLSKKIQAEVEEEEVPAEFSDEDEEEVAIAPEAPAEFSAEDDEVAPEAPAEFSDEEEAPAPEELPAELSDEDEDEIEIPAEEGVIEINGVKYAPVVSEEGEEEEADVEEEYSEEDVEDGHEEVSDADLDLEAVLKELEDELNEEEDEEEPQEEQVTEGEVDSISPDNDSNETLDSSDIGDAENKEPAPEASDSSDVGQGSEEPAEADAPAAGSENPEDEKGQPADEASLAESSEDPLAPPQEDAVSDVEEEIDLEEIIKALQEEEGEEEEAEAASEQVAKIQSDLDEHRNVVKYLRSKLNEVNLLNAKLLFTNKLFRVFGLNTGQKVKVVETFDRAKNIREVKLVYSTMAESFGASSEAKPEIVKESKGSASKPVASTKSPKQEVISEGDSMRDRFQRLAKII